MKAFLLLALLSTPAFAGNWVKLTDDSTVVAGSTIHAVVFVKNAKMVGSVVTLDDHGVSTTTAKDGTVTVMDITMNETIDCANMFRQLNSATVHVSVNGVEDAAYNMGLQMQANSMTGHPTRLPNLLNPTYAWACAQ